MIRKLLKAATKVGPASIVTAHAAALALTFPHAALAQTDEIQVYNAEIAEPGKFNLTVHDNYTPSGIKTPAFPGAIVSQGSLNGVPEWAYGVSPWMEAGLYLPLYSLPRSGGVQIDGFKLRTLFVEPEAAKHSFFYGVNFEFSFNSEHWDEHRYTQEIRPIVGWRFGKMDLIVNPILDNSWEGFGKLDFAPETRLDYNVSDVWQIAAEEYDDFGAIKRFSSAREQTHELFGVVDYNGKPLNVEAGVGFGLTPATDRLTLKLILSKDLN
ncbi:MAG TPA: hypothetical protein VMU59_09045 [Caulobacteraceae bacterium]|nr:hypothetical protein [Caulobacteraceae bacterium]